MSTVFICLSVTVYPWRIFAYLQYVLYLPIYWPNCPSVCLSVCPSACLSKFVSLFFCWSVCLNIYWPASVLSIPLCACLASLKLCLLLVHHCLFFKFTYLLSVWCLSLVLSVLPVCFFYCLSMSACLSVWLLVWLPCRSVLIVCPIFLPSLFLHVFVWLSFLHLSAVGLSLYTFSVCLSVCLSVYFVSVHASTCTLCIKGQYTMWR